MITTAPELIYMLKVNIGIALFYAFYVSVSAILYSILKVKSLMIPF